MNLVKRALIVSAGAAAAAGLLAGPASAATSGRAFPPFTVATASTHVTTAAPGNGGFWAGVSVTRTATVSGGTPVPTFLCGAGSFTCFRYRATLQDHGTFQTFFNAFTPNQSRPGRHIRGIVNGRVNGSATFASFYASKLPSRFNVPFSFSGPSSAILTWPEEFFPAGTRFAGLQMSPWTFTYTGATFCGLQIWTDASWNGHGDLRFDGNITGC